MLLSVRLCQSSFVQFFYDETANVNPAVLFMNGRLKVLTQQGIDDAAVSVFFFLDKGFDRKEIE